MDAFVGNIFPVALADGLESNFTSVRITAYNSTSDIILAVARGEVDAGLAAISATDPREILVDFTQAYYSTGLGIATRGAPTVFEAVEQLIGTFSLVVAGFAALLLSLTFFGALLLMWFEAIAPGPRPVFRRDFAWGLRDAITMQASLLLGAETRQPSGALSGPAAMACSAGGRLLTVVVTAISTAALTT